MKKFIAVIITLFAFAIYTNADDLPNVQLEMRGYDMVEIPQGTFIPVMATSDISTENCTEGYKVKFLSTTNLYMYETIVVPENSEFWGYIEKVNLPVVGTNGSMKIKLVKMITPNGQETPMRGYIYTGNNNLIGGEMSAPVKWIKMPHYQSAFKYVNLSARPSQERAMGVHTGIKTGSNEVIVLTAPLFVLHTLSD